MSSPDTPLGDGTRLVHGGDEPAVPGAPLRPSPVFAAPYHLGDEAPGRPCLDGYARPDNATLRVFERAVGELDGGDRIPTLAALRCAPGRSCGMTGPALRLAVADRREPQLQCAGSRRSR